MMREFSIWMTGHDLAKYRPGIGPNAWGYWRLLIPFQGRFFEEGEEHDLGCSLGGNERDKQEVDEKFFEGCMDKSKKNPFAIFFSCIYYIAVANFGHFYFNYQQK